MTHSELESINTQTWAVCSQRDIWLVFLFAQYVHKRLKEFANHSVKSFRHSPFALSDAADSSNKRTKSRQKASGFVPEKSEKNYLISCTRFATVPSTFVRNARWCEKNSTCISYRFSLERDICKSNFVISSVSKSCGVEAKGQQQLMIAARFFRFSRGIW